MKSFLNIALAFVLGAVFGSIANMMVITHGPKVIPLPEGADFTTPEAAAASIPLLETHHFIVPFVAHALGTLLGAFLAAKIAKTRRVGVALAIGVLFLASGAMMIMSLDSPMWFNVVDLVFAYLPMAWLGARAAGATQAAE